VLSAGTGAEATATSEGAGAFEPVDPLEGPVLFEGPTPPEGEVLSDGVGSPEEAAPAEGVDPGDGAVLPVAEVGSGFSGFGGGLLACPELRRFSKSRKIERICSEMELNPSNISSIPLATEGMPFFDPPFFTSLVLTMESVFVAGVPISCS